MRIFLKSNHWIPLQFKVLQQQRGQYLVFLLRGRLFLDIDDMIQKEVVREMHSFH